MAETQYAVLIASSSFPKEPRLQPLLCPENDVEGMRDRLTSPPFGLFDAERVRLFKNAPHYEVQFALEQVLRAAGKNDLVLIYYSGHGETDEAGRLHLTTSNTMLDALASTSIPVHVLKSYIDVARSTRIVLILDCCYAGAAGKMFNLRGDTIGEELKQVSTGRGIYVLTASTAVQTAQEREKDRYGMMTKHILDALTEPEADVDQDGFISMDELYAYVHRHVQRDAPQTPQKFAYAIEGNLYIARTGQIPREERRKQIRSLLYDLAASNQITENLLNQTLAVNAQHPAALSSEGRRQEELLDQLLDKRIMFGQFVERWYNVTASAAMPLAEITPTAVSAPSAGPGTAFHLSLRRTLPKHPKGVTSGVLSPGGGLLATGAGDGTLRIWDVAKAEIRFQETAHTGAVWALAFTPDGSEVASGGADGKVRVFSASAGRAMRQYDTGKAVLALAFNTEKALAVGGLDDSIRIFRPDSAGAVQVATQDRDVRCLLFSGGHLITGGSDGLVRVYDDRSHELQRTLEGHRSSALSLAASAAHRVLASGGRDGTVRLWDLSAWVPQAVLRGHKHSVQSLAIHPNGSTILSGGADGALRFWDIRTLQNTGTVESGHICVNFLAISPRGDQVATGGVDQTVRFWQLK